MTGEKVAVVSWGAVTAAGVGTAALCRALEDPSWRPDLTLERPDAPLLPVASCHSFQAREHLPALVARRLDRPSRFFAVAAREALAGVGAPLPWDRLHTGVAAGTFNAGTDALLQVLEPVFLGNPDEAPPAQFPSTVANAAASQLGILEKLGGPNLTFAEKQAGGLRALLVAARLLKTGRAQAMIAGGVDEAQWLYSECLARLGALGDGSGSAPLWGEGAATLLLSRGRTPQPRAILAGWGEGSLPCDPFRYPSRPTPLIQAVEAALSSAKLTPDGLDMVVSLANGSPGLAALELEMLKKALSGRRPAAVAVTDRLGEGSFAATVRALVAALAVSGECLPRWPAPAHLAESGFSNLSKAPVNALVTAQAAGGSALAVVLSRPSIG